MVDAAINIMRRIIQSTEEVIHLGHDRSVEEVVNTAIQEDANAIAMTSYQGGHNLFYMYDLLKEKGAGHIKNLWWRWWCYFTFGNCRITSLRNYSYLRPDDGRSMGLRGMINDLVNSRLSYRIN
jgi:methylmalonyl-CoA mutase